MPSITSTALNRRSSSSTNQCVVALRPSSNPACASTSDPEHTLLVHVTSAARALTQSTARSFFISGRVPSPPGTISTSSFGASSMPTSGRMCMPLLQRTSFASSPIAITRCSGLISLPIANTSQGPMKSSSSIPSNIKIPVVVIWPPQ